MPPVTDIELRGVLTAVAMWLVIGFAIFLFVVFPRFEFVQYLGAAISREFMRPSSKAVMGPRYLHAHEHDEWLVGSCIVLAVFIFVLLAFCKRTSTRKSEGGDERSDVETEMEALGLTLAELRSRARKGNHAKATYFTRGASSGPFRHVDGRSRASVLEADELEELRTRRRAEVRNGRHNEDEDEFVYRSDNLLDRERAKVSLFGAVAAVGAAARIQEQVARNGHAYAKLEEGEAQGDDGTRKTLRGMAHAAVNLQVECAEQLPRRGTPILGRVHAVGSADRNDISRGSHCSDASAWPIAAGAFACQPAVSESAHRGPAAPVHSRASPPPKKPQKPMHRPPATSHQRAATHLPPATPLPAGTTCRAAKSSSDDMQPGNSGVVRHGATLSHPQLLAVSDSKSAAPLISPLAGSGTLVARSMLVPADSWRSECRQHEEESQARALAARGVPKVPSMRSPDYVSAAARALVQQTSKRPR